MRYAPFALPPRALDARLARLRWDYRKWDTHVRGKPTVQPGALVLTRDEHAEASRLAEELFALADDAMARWVRDADITREMGVPADVVPLARGTAGRVTRVDL